MRKLNTILLVLYSLTGFSQKSEIDSLSAQLEENIQDTTKAKILNKLSRHVMTQDPELALEYAERALKISISSDFVMGQITSYHNIGYANYIQSNYGKAVTNWKRTLLLRELQGDKGAIATSLNNLGTIYYDQSNYLVALDYFLKALTINKELDNKPELANNYNNIGVIYHDQSDYPRALEYYFKALDIDIELDNQQGMAYSYGNIGVIYQYKKDFPAAHDYYLKDLDIEKAIGNKEGMAGAYSNLGNLFSAFYEAGDSTANISDKWVIQDRSQLLDTAMYYQQKALTLDQQNGDRHSMTFDLSGIASIHLEKGEIGQALIYYQEATHLADSIGATKELSEAHSGQATCYQKLGNYFNALEQYKIFTTIKDSIFNEDKSKDLGKMEAKHEFEVAEVERQRKEADILKTAQAIEARRNNLQYSGILIFMVLVFASVFMLRQVSIPIWLAEGMIFFAFLLFFEFTLVLLDPYIEDLSHGAPAYKLMFNALLAALIFPLHSFFEENLKNRLVKK